MSELKKSLIEAVESKGAGIVIPMLNPKDLQVKISAVVPPAYADAIDCDKRWSERFAKQCEEVVEQHKNVLDFEDESRFNGNEPVVAEKPVKIEDQKLTESTHAAVAKPEGDKVKSFNNALKYAKRDEVPYCYGYFNSRLGKFFAFDQPFKWDGDDKAFRAQYKNTSTIYVAYPNNAFVKESMQESYLDNIKNPDYWQHQVDYQLEHFGRVGGGLYQDLDEAGFYLDKDYKVTKKVKDTDESLLEDTIKNSKGKWVNKGKEGTHGEFDTKKEADAQRKAMFANGYKESVNEAWKDFAFIVKCNDGPKELVRVVADDKSEAEKFAKNMYAANHTTYADDRYNKWSVEEVDQLREAPHKNLTEDVEKSAEEDVREPEAEVKIDLEKFKPWGKAVDTYIQIQEAGKMEDFERVLEDGWPEGIKDQTLNELLIEDIDWLAEVLDMKFVDKKVN